MKNIIIGLIVAALLVGGIAGASALYKNLSEQYGDQNQGGAVDTTPNGSVSSDKENQEIFEDEKGSASGEGGSSEEITKEETTADEIVSEEKESEETTPQETTEKTELEFFAKDFTVYDENGNAFKLSDFAGKPIVVNFWGTWCPYCKLEMPDFNEAYESFPDVQFVMVNVGDYISKAMNYLDSEGFEFPVYFDLAGDAQYTYSVYSFPTTIFFNSDGSYSDVVIGATNYETIAYKISLIK